MTDLEKLDFLLMLAYIRGKKSECVKKQDFNGACLWREKEVSMNDTAVQLFEEFLKRNNLPVEEDLDEKDKEINRLRGIIEKLQSDSIQSNS